MNFHICFPYSDFPFHANRYYNAVAQAHAGNTERIVYDPEFKRFQNQNSTQGEEQCRMPEVLFRRYKRVLEKKKALWIETNCQKLLGFYQVFLAKNPEEYNGSLERQIALFSHAEADPYVLVSCQIQITSCEFVDEKYVLTGSLNTIIFDQTDTLTVGSPCRMEVGYLDVGMDGRLRHPEVLCGDFVDSKDLTAFCYPMDLFRTHQITHYVSPRDLTLLETALHVVKSPVSLRDVVEGLDWKKISS